MALVVAISASVVSVRDYHRDSGLRITITVAIAADWYDRATAKACEHERCEKGKQGFSHDSLQ